MASLHKSIKALVVDCNIQRAACVLCESHSLLSCVQTFDNCYLEAHYDIVLCLLTAHPVGFNAEYNSSENKVGAEIKHEEDLFE